MSAITRRELLASAAIMGSAGILLGYEASAAASANGGYQPKPLPFNPAKLSGISEKLITSHHKNNYSGAVRRLNAIQNKIKQLPRNRFSSGL